MDSGNRPPPSPSAAPGPSQSPLGRSLASAIDLSRDTPEPEQPPHPVTPATPRPPPPPSPNALRSRAFSTTPLPAFGPPSAIHPIPPGDDTILTMDQMRFLGRGRQFPDAHRCSLWIDDTMCDAFLACANDLIKHIELHLSRFRAMGDAQRATTFLRVGSYPLQHNTMQDIEEQLLEYADKIAHKYCPVADCPHPRVIKAEQHYASLALHGSEPLTRRRLRPPTTPQPIKLGPLPPLPTTVPAYLISCHEIQPFSGKSAGPRKYSPCNNFPIINAQGRKGDPLMVSNGKGIPDEGMSVYWSSDFFRPINQVDSDDEDATVYAPSVAESTGTGMMGTGRLSRGRRSMSVLSDTSFIPDSPQSPYSARISRLPSLPAVPERRSARVPLAEQASSSSTMSPPPRPSQHVPPSRSGSYGRLSVRDSTPTSSQPGPSRQGPSTSMLPPVGIERDGVVTLTRNIPILPLADLNTSPPQGMAGSPVIVRSRDIDLRETPNPLQYVRLGRGQEPSEQQIALDAAIALEDDVRRMRDKYREEMDQGLESEPRPAEQASIPSATGPDTNGTTRPAARPSTSAMARTLAGEISGANSPKSARASPSATGEPQTGVSTSTASSAALPPARKRKRPTLEELEQAAHVYARRQTGMRIGMEYWTEYSHFLDCSELYMAEIEEEGGWLEESTSRGRGPRAAASSNGGEGRAASDV